MPLRCGGDRDQLMAAGGSTNAYFGERGLKLHLHCGDHGNSTNIACCLKGFTQFTAADRWRYDARFTREFAGMILALGGLIVLSMRNADIVIVFSSSSTFCYNLINL